MFSNFNALKMKYFDKFFMQGLSKYCFKFYHDFQRFFQEYSRNIFKIFPQN
jgi:hypothetical protein